MENKKPICPYCNEQIDSIKTFLRDVKSDKTIIKVLKGQNIIYCCPKCLKVLSVGGAWG